MTKQELIDRNKKFVLNVFKMIEMLPLNRTNDAITRQLVRCSSSVGANYRAACRAKSNADFINKLKIVEEETDESIYFLELLYEIDKGKQKDQIQALLLEANELLSIYVASIKTIREKVNVKANVQGLTIVNHNS